MGSPTPQPDLVVRSRRIAGDARPSSWPRHRAIRVSIRPKLTEELRSLGPRRESARKRTPYKDEGYAPFQDPFPTLWISQFASFAHFLCWVVLPRAPSTSMQVPGTFCQRLRFSIFAQPKRTCTVNVTRDLSRRAAKSSKARQFPPALPSALVHSVHCFLRR